MRRIFKIPSKAKIMPEEIVVKDDIIVADRSLVERSLRTDGRIFVGRYATVGGLFAKGEIMIDDMSKVLGDVHSEESISLGDLVKISGHLYCGGDLDIGGNVEISKGFLAKGYIRISSGVSLFVYILLYLLYLLQIGKSKEVDEILKTLEEEIQVRGDYMLIPYDSKITKEKLFSKYSVFVGQEAEVYGSVETRGRVTVSSRAIIHGSIKASGNVYIGPYVYIDGAVQGKFVKVSRGAVINSGIKAETVRIVKGAQVYGKVLSPGGVEFLRDEDLEKDKIERERIIPGLDEIFEE
ncbi:MAG: polymer-forming cytoskeletal protein [Euryarchaeota archaeon]|nr:polymer-forming cytoskeletal protein [Euryarchaeota archaeon]